MKLARAVSIVDRLGIVLVYPIANKPEPPSLWSALHPRTRGTRARMCRPRRAKLDAVLERSPAFAKELARGVEAVREGAAARRRSWDDDEP